MPRAIIALLLLIGFALPAWAEPLVADISESVVKITTGFTNGYAWALNFR